MDLAYQSCVLGLVHKLLGVKYGGAFMTQQKLFLISLRGLHWLQVKGRGLMIAATCEMQGTKLTVVYYRTDNMYLE